MDTQTIQNTVKQIIYRDILVVKTAWQILALPFCFELLGLSGMVRLTRPEVIVYSDQ